MGFAELVVLVSDPAFIAAASAVWLGLGALGSLVELVGAKTQLPRLERFGQALEAIFADLPKLRHGSRLTALLKTLGRGHA